MCEVYLVSSRISNQVLTDTIALPHWGNCFQFSSILRHTAALFLVRTIDEVHVTEKCSLCVTSTWEEIDRQLKGNGESTGERIACGSYTFNISEKKQSSSSRITATESSHNPFWLQPPFSIFAVLWSPNSVVYFGKIYIVSLRAQTAPERVSANKKGVSVES